MGSWLASCEALAPAARTSASVEPSSVITPVTASWFMVMVPVLSTQSTSMVAASSAALSRVTSTPRLASSLEPRAMLTVNMTGSATGTALISRTSTSGTSSRSGAPRIKDRVTTTARSAPTIRKSQRTTLAMTASMCSFGLASWTSVAVRPKEVFAPVRRTTPLPSPRRTTEPDGRTPPGSFSTSWDSPVRADWSMPREPESSSRSAGTKSPDRTRMMSPGTSSRAATRSQAPSRSTRALTCSFCWSVATTPAARRSWTKPSTAFTTSRALTTARSEYFPRTAERTMMISSIHAETPQNLPRNSRSGWPRGRAISL